MSDVYVQPIASAHASYYAKLSITPPDVVNALRTVGPCSGSEVKKIYKYCSVSCTDRCFVSYDLNVSSRAAGFNLVVSVYSFFYSQSHGSHWLPLYMTNGLRLNIFFCVLLKKQSHLHLESPGGMQINMFFFFFWGELSLLANM